MPIITRFSTFLLVQNKKFLNNYFSNNAKDNSQNNSHKRYERYVVNFLKLSSLAVISLALLQDRPY